MKKLINKKLISIIIVIVIAGLIYFAYNIFLSPIGITGEKKVAIQIINENINTEENYNFRTEHKFLYELMKEYEEDLGAGFKEYSYGIMLVELLNYKAN